VTQTHTFLRGILKWSAVAALSFAMCEFSLRVWGFAPVYGIKIQGLPEVNSQLRLTLDPDRLYRMKPWPEVNLNSWGFRDVEFGPPKNGVPRAVVIGDSFPMGLAVFPEKTFPKVIPSFIQGPSEVLNLGIQGYGPDQEFDIIQRELLSLKPTCVFWSVFPGNDFSDVIKDRLYAPRTDGVLERLKDNWVTENLPTLRLKIAFNLLRYGSFFPREVEEDLDKAFFQDQVHILYKTDDPWRTAGVPLAQTLYTKGREFLEAHGVKVVAGIIPSYEIIQDDTKLVKLGVPKEEYFINEKLAGDALSNAGIPYVDLSPYFVKHSGLPLYEVADRHLSVEGHRLAAQLFAPLVEKCLK
jgi:hypothetical protein